MFDHRLGLALHKSIGEIRAMPYAEYKDWWTFYLLEPWGWWNEEINTARIITMIHNVNAKKAKAPSDFIRDMAEELMKHLQPAPDLSELSHEEQKRRITQAIQKDFGIK